LRCPCPVPRRLHCVWWRKEVVDRVGRVPLAAVSASSQSGTRCAPELRLTLVEQAPPPPPRIGVVSPGVHEGCCSRYCHRCRVIVIVVGIAYSLQPTLAEQFLVAASGSLASSSWLGSHMAHGLRGEVPLLSSSLLWASRWDRMRSTSEWRRRVIMVRMACSRGIMVVRNLCRSLLAST